MPKESEAAASVRRAAREEHRNVRVYVFVNPSLLKLIDAKADEMRRTRSDAIFNLLLDELTPA